jgi:hypothetical protein
VKLLVPDRALRLVDDRGRLNRGTRRKLESHIKVGLTKEICPRKVRGLNNVNVKLKTRGPNSGIHSIEGNAKFF